MPDGQRYELSKAVEADRLVRSRRKLGYASWQGASPTDLPRIGVKLVGPSFNRAARRSRALC